VDPTEKSNDVTGLDPCPGCGHPENPPENRFCGQCGASLERALALSGELAPGTKELRATLRERFLPDKLGPVGKTLAVGLGAAAASVGATWLSRQAEKSARLAPLQDAARARRELGSGSGTEYLHHYVLKEATFFLKEGRKIRRSYSSELKIESSRVEE
jgi:hypothetical protein